MADLAKEILDGEPEGAFRPAEPPAAEVLPGRFGEAVKAFDERVDHAWDAIRGNPTADRIFYGASAVGDFSLIWQIASVATALFGREKEAVRLSASLGAESALINLGVKSLFRRSRPTRTDHAVHGLRTPKSSSFPSGHATSAFMAATLLTTGRPRSRPFWFALAAVVATSRVHVRIHHGSDVAAGAVIGVGLGRLVRKIWRI
ncbi:MAG TPA: phosphatase PAP2 family protein [Nocardioidaceae bacterium]|nr:phosphatase PAP2 family protein [Nocardioidaceae bacterium]